MARGSASSPGEGGANYLASVSDLVAALIFIFIIMLAIFAYQLANVTKEQVEAKEDLSERIDELSADDETRDRILKVIAGRLQSAGIRVEVLSDQGVLRFSDNAINFPSGGDRPVPHHWANVGRLAHVLAEVLPCYISSVELMTEASGSKNDAPSYCRPQGDRPGYVCRERQRFPWLLGTLLIEGHTDNVPVASGNRFHNNLELSSMRAATVHRMITACEPGLDLLLNTDGYSVLSTSGYGYARPVTNDPAQAGENRRIDLRFLLEPPKEALESDVQADVRQRIVDEP